MLHHLHILQVKPLRKNHPALTRHDLPNSSYSPHYPLRNSSLFQRFRACPLETCDSQNTFSIPARSDSLSPPKITTHTVHTHIFPKSQSCYWCLQTCKKKKD
jgi:hypothetical protein